MPGPAPAPHIQTCTPHHRPTRHPLRPAHRAGHSFPLHSTCHRTCHPVTHSWVTRAHCLIAPCTIAHLASGTGAFPFYLHPAQAGTTPAPPTRYAHNRFSTDTLALLAPSSADRARRFGGLPFCTAHQCLSAWPWCHQWGRPGPLCCSGVEAQQSIPKTSSAGWQPAPCLQRRLHSRLANAFLLPSLKPHPTRAAAARRLHCSMH